MSASPERRPSTMPVVNTDPATRAPGSSSPSNEYSPARVVGGRTQLAQRRIGVCRGGDDQREPGSWGQFGRWRPAGIAVHVVGQAPSSPSPTVVSLTANVRTVYGVLAGRPNGSGPIN